MLGFNSARSKAIDAFGVALAADLAERFPTALEPGEGKKSPDKLLRALTHVATRAIEYRTEHRLGIYGKARLLREFGAELGRRGYSAKFVEAATAALVKSMAARSGTG
jgi:hypothetical protein